MSAAFRSSLLTAAAILFCQAGATYSADAPQVRVSEVTLLSDMECFKIETPSATYLYGKRGAGFASILDPDGHDWISYHHGDKALGEYRGLPKCGQPTKYFHCGYSFGLYPTDNPFTSTIASQQPDHVRLHSETKNGDAACDWDFYADHATFTLTKIPGGKYWFLYEGTPGGELDVANDYVLRPGGKKTPLSEPWNEVVPWVVVGSKKTPFTLLLSNHQTGDPVDSYVSWPYKPEKDGALNQMCVLGFGRPAWTDPKQHQPQLTKLPARFTIALMKGAEESKVKAILQTSQSPAHE